MAGPLVPGFAPDRSAVIGGTDDVVLIFQEQLRVLIAVIGVFHQPVQAFDLFGGGTDRLGMVLNDANNLAKGQLAATTEKPVLGSVIVDSPIAKAV